MKKVIIGIVARHFKNNGIRPNLYIKDEVKDAIFFNGAIPIGLIPPTKDISVVTIENEREAYENLDKIISPKQKELFIAQIQMCDGIVLQGGAVADVYEIFIARYCYENDIPILGICEGQSNLVRGLGGTTRLVDDQEKHNQSESLYVHDISIKKGTFLHKIIGKTKIKVNSRHHYAVADFRNLDISATDDDGNIEVVEDKSKKFFLGVRFHPESLCNIDENHNAIFKAFIDSCR